MNLFKVAFKIVRNNSKNIYKGFGFKHLSDATQYYVHPDNQSYNGTTTLCQPIGEAVILFSSMLTAIIKSSDSVKPFGDYWVSSNKDEFFLEIKIPENWREDKVLEPEIFSYKAYLKGENLTVAAYDKNTKLIKGNMEHVHLLYKLLPTFCILIAREMERNSQYRSIMEKFLESPEPDTFVNLNEDLYQMHKTDDYNLNYGEVPQINKEDFTSFSSTYETIRENKLALTRNEKVAVSQFDRSEFSEEQLSLIPALTEEFVIPNKLLPLCNAIQAGDVRSTLFHGPAGTGKTISCKLVCQTIGLPIMETINCTENLDEFVLGKFIPQDDKIIFKESYVTKAIRDGGAVVFEEINFAKPQYLAFLNSLLDDNGFVRLDNGEVVRRHKNFRFFATMNLGYFGTKELNQALYNRFNAIIEVAALSDESIERMLVARVPECKEVTKKIIGVYHKLQKKIEAEELDVVISPRNLENWARLAKYEGYVRAAEKAIVPVAKCDRVLEEAIRGIIELYKW
ncbi:MAG: AAA family ATPase [Spirochaetaceae bacterium]|nr:AAA family ATPase [Spirochaetaceae bacterium]